MKKIHKQTMPRATKKLVKQLQKEKFSFLNDFYLSGGTGLSLQLGHRQSIDLDFFSEKDFNPVEIQKKIESKFSLKDFQLAKNTLNLYINKVEVQFLGYPYPLLKPVYNWQGIQLSSVLDIGCTKLHTISMRGSRKDFVDLYFILKKYSLKKLFNSLDKKYPKTDFSKVHIIKSLVYFKKADNQPMPKMIKQVSWPEIKTTIKQKVKNFG